MRKLTAFISKKFKILVLVDLTGTLLFRTTHKQEDFIESNFNVKAERSFKIAGKKYFLRPGFKEFIRKLAEHPRCTLGFYTSMSRKNLLKILFQVLSSK